MTGLIYQIKLKKLRKNFAISEPKEIIESYVKLFYNLKLLTLFNSI